jgi:suppressor of G2 allele of SKP1
MKIELVLRKATPGKWPTLRQDGAGGFDHIAIGQAPALSFNTFKESLKKFGHEDVDEVTVAQFGGDEQAWYKDLLEKLRGGSTAGNAAQGTAAQGTAAQGSAEPKPTIKAPEKPKPAAASTAAPVTKQSIPHEEVPAYPSSSKTGPKNWDNIDVDDEDEGEGKDGGDINSFFQKIYRDADPDTKRAMMKSFVESNGTSLSTSWSEAKEKHYETLPPDGAEAKEWNDQ